MSQKARKTIDVKQMTVLALFMALIVVLGFTPLGLIPLGFINVTTLHIPVIVGTLVLGLEAGLLLGETFGVVSYISALIKPSTLVSTLMGATPLMVPVMCIVPRMCIPLVVWGVQKLINRFRNERSAFLASAVCGSILNALICLQVPKWLVNGGMSEVAARSLSMVIGMVACIGVGYAIFCTLNMRNKVTAVAAILGTLTNTVLYLGTMLILYISCGLDSAGVLSLIGGTALLAGSAEAIVAAILCTPLVSALVRIKK